jgi:hypothetical protein
MRFGRLEMRERIGQCVPAASASAFLLPVLAYGCFSTICVCQSQNYSSFEVQDGVVNSADAIVIGDSTSSHREDAEN